MLFRLNGSKQKAFTIISVTGQLFTSLTGSNSVDSLHTSNNIFSCLCKESNPVKRINHIEIYFFKPISILMVLLASPMLMDPHPGQQHAGLHYAV